MDEKFMNVDGYTIGDVVLIALELEEIFSCVDELYNYLENLQKNEVDLYNHASVLADFKKAEKYFKKHDLRTTLSWAKSREEMLQRRAKKGLFEDNYADGMKPEFALTKMEAYDWLLEIGKTAQANKYKPSEHKEVRLESIESPELNLAIKCYKLFLHSKTSKTRKELTHDIEKYLAKCGLSKIRITQMTLIIISGVKE